MPAIGPLGLQRQLQGQSEYQGLSPQLKWSPAVLCLSKHCLEGGGGLPLPKVTFNQKEPGSQ
jgi:hypothetical protein